jgi:acetyl esterase/lipase
LLRLIFALVCCALAFLAVVPAPTHLAWELAILVSEWGYVLAVVVLVLVLPGWRHGPRGGIAAGLAVAAALLVLSPLVRARRIARALPDQLESSFGRSGAQAQHSPLGRTTPLSLRDLLLLVRTPKVPVRTLTYAHRSTGDMQLDLYARQQMPPLPIVLMIHGGSWQSGDRTQLASLNKYLADHGYAVAAISYRFAPEHPFPAALQDARDALAYLKSNAPALGLDSTRIALVGRSAGGQLALLTAYTAHDPAVRGAVSFYGPTDMRWGYEHPSRKLVLDSKKVLEDYLAGTPATAPATYDNASPLHFAASDAPPTLMIHGVRDELVSIENSRRLDRALADAHVPRLLVELPWATHGCDFNFSGPCGQLSTYAVERFLLRVMR